MGSPPRRLPSSPSRISCSSTYSFWPADADAVLRCAYRVGLWLMTQELTLLHRYRQYYVKCASPPDHNESQGVVTTCLMHHPAFCHWRAPDELQVPGEYCDSVAKCFFGWLSFFSFPTRSDCPVRNGGIDIRGITFKIPGLGIQELGLRVAFRGLGRQAEIECAASQDVSRALLNLLRKRESAIRRHSSPKTPAMYGMTLFNPSSRFWLARKNPRRSFSNSGHIPVSVSHTLAVCGVMQLKFLKTNP